MTTARALYDLGQSLWLDNITRDLLDRGTLKGYLEGLCVTGLTSNPTIFEHAIRSSAAYDAAIRSRRSAGQSGEELFFDLALEDLTRAADLFRPVHDRTGGVDGWVSLEVSPLLAHDTAATIQAASSPHINIEIGCARATRLSCARRMPPCRSIAARKMAEPSQTSCVALV